MNGGVHALCELWNHAARVAHELDVAERGAASGTAYGVWLTRQREGH